MSSSLSDVDNMSLNQNSITLIVVVASYQSLPGSMHVTSPEGLIPRSHLAYQWAKYLVIYLKVHATIVHIRFMHHLRHPKKNIPFRYLFVSPVFHPSLLDHSPAS